MTRKKLGPVVKNDISYYLLYEVLKAAVWYQRYTKYTILYNREADDETAIPDKDNVFGGSSEDNFHNML